MASNSYRQPLPEREEYYSEGIASRIMRWLGDVFAEGRAIAKNKDKRVDSILLGLVLILVAVGLVMLYSASYANASYYTGSSSYYIRRQLLFAGVGLAVMALFSLFPPERWKDTTGLMLFLSYVLLLVVLIIKWSGKASGEGGELERWIEIGPISIQPSEITKFAVIVFCAYWASTRSKMMQDPIKGVVPFIVILGSTAVLLILQPHLSGTILVVLIGATLMWVGGVNWKSFAVLAGAAIVAVFLMIYFDIGGYWKERIDVWFDPYSDALGAGWQNIQAMYAMASGGIFGQGFGNSRQKYLYISAPQNDFIYAVICEELGFVGAVAIIVLFLVFVWRGFTISLSAPGKFQKLLGVGITAQIGWQALLNVGVVTRALPNTGISLPFFSYGGSSLLMLLFEMGILLAISRNSTRKRV